MIPKNLRHRGVISCFIIFLNFIVCTQDVEYPKQRNLEIHEQTMKTSSPDTTITDTTKKTKISHDYSTPEASEEYNFRKIRWGMTKSQVKLAEKKATFVNSEKRLIASEYINSLSYATRVADEPCELIYGFLPNKGVQIAVYYFYFPKAYDKIIKAISAKWGEPHISTYYQAGWQLKKEKLFIRVDRKQKYIPVYYLTEAFLDWQESEEKETLKESVKDF